MVVKREPFVSSGLAHSGMTNDNDEKKRKKWKMQIQHTEIWNLGDCCKRFLTFNFGVFNRRLVRL